MIKPDVIPPEIGIPLALVLWAIMLAPLVRAVLQPAAGVMLMSRHHRASHHTTATHKLRPEIEARLPLPCTECGKPVYRDQKWHVAHITPASQGGRTTRANTGAAHALCNLRAGGKLGAAATNGNRRRRTDAREGIRSW